MHFYANYNTYIQTRIQC